MLLWPILSFVLLMSSNMNLFIDYLFIIFWFLFFSASDGHLLNKVNVKVLFLISECQISLFPSVLNVSESLLAAHVLD